MTMMVVVVTDGDDGYGRGEGESSSGDGDGDGGDGVCDDVGDGDDSVKVMVNHSLDSPTKMLTGRAMHLCPEAPNAAAVSAFSVKSLSASGRIVAWFLAPKLA